MSYRIRTLASRINKYGSEHEFARHLAIHDGLTDEEKNFLNEYFDSKGRKSFASLRAQQSKTNKALEKFMRPTSMYSFFSQKLEDGLNIGDAMHETANKYSCDDSTVRKIIKPLRDRDGNNLSDSE